MRQILLATHICMQLNQHYTCLVLNMLKKVFNWSEVYLSEMTCYKIHTLVLRLYQNFRIRFLNGFHPFVLW